MWPLGHAAIAYLCYSASTRWQRQSAPTALPVLAVLFGSQFPDLVDKPLAWYLGALPTGRTLAHSLIVLVPLCAIVLIVAQAFRQAELGVAFSIGALSHAVVDAIPALWGQYSAARHLLWPVTSVQEYEQEAPTVLGLLVESLSSAWFLSEFVFAALALWLWVRDGRPGLELLRR